MTCKGTFTSIALAHFAADARQADIRPWLGYPSENGGWLIVNGGAVAVRLRFRQGSPECIVVAVDDVELIYRKDHGAFEKVINDFNQALGLSAAGDIHGAVAIAQSRRAA